MSWKRHVVRAIAWRMRAVHCAGTHRPRPLRRHGVALVMDERSHHASSLITRWVSLRATHPTTMQVEPYAPTFSPRYSIAASVPPLPWGIFSALSADLDDAERAQNHRRIDMAHMGDAERLAGEVADPGAEHHAAFFLAVALQRGRIKAVHRHRRHRVGALIGFRDVEAEHLAFGPRRAPRGAPLRRAGDGAERRFQVPRHGACRSPCAARTADAPARCRHICGSAQLPSRSVQSQ